MTASEHHEKAMEHAELAVIAKRDKKMKVYEKHTVSAALCELECVGAMERGGHASNPAFMTILISALSLAAEAKMKFTHMYLKDKIKNIQDQKRGLK